MTEVVRGTIIVITADRVEIQFSQPDDPRANRSFSYAEGDTFEILVGDEADGAEGVNWLR